MTEQELQEIRKCYDDLESSGVRITAFEAFLPKLLDEVEWLEKIAVSNTKQYLELKQENRMLSQLTVNNTKEYERLRKALQQIIDTTGQWSWEDAIKVARKALEGGTE